MKKFKEYTLKINKNPCLYDAIKQKGTELGYHFYKYDKENLYWLYLNGNGETGWNIKDAFTHSHHYVNCEISIRDFFKLTPADVVIEPELFNFNFTYENIRGSSSIVGELYQSQIDEIEAIMEREL